VNRKDAPEAQKMKQQDNRHTHCEKSQESRTRSFAPLAHLAAD
jgi:hypothetical protein